jgi:hypothetical protein
MTRTRAVIVASLIGLAGCSAEPPDQRRVAVSGRVLFEGKPLSDASIIFLPDLDKQGQGGNAPIWNGRYSIPAEEGPSSGEFNVLITDLRREQGVHLSGTDRPLLPQEYAELNGLRVTIPANRKSWGFDFDLKRPQGEVSTEAGPASRATTASGGH